MDFMLGFSFVVNFEAIPDMPGRILMLILLG